MLKNCHQDIHLNGKKWQSDKAEYMQIIWKTFQTKKIYSTSAKRKEIKYFIKLID